MAYQTPKTDWTSSDAPSSSDFNRIEGNIDDLSRVRADSTKIFKPQMLTADPVNAELGQLWFRTDL